MTSPGSSTSPVEFNKRFSSDFLGNLQNAIGRRNNGSSGYLSSASDDELALSKSPILDSAVANKPDNEASVDVEALWNLTFGQKLLDNSVQRHRISISKWRSRRRPTSMVVDTHSTASSLAASYLSGISEEPSMSSCQRPTSIVHELKSSENRIEPSEDLLIRCRSTDRTLTHDSSKLKKRPVSLCLTSLRPKELWSTPTTMELERSEPISIKCEAKNVHPKPKPKEDNCSSSDQKEFDVKEQAVPTIAIEYRNKVGAKPDSSADTTQKRFSVAETSRLFGGVASSTVAKNFSKSSLQLNTIKNTPSGQRSSVDEKKVTSMPHDSSLITKSVGCTSNQVASSSSATCNKSSLPSTVARGAFHKSLPSVPINKIRSASSFSPNLGAESQQSLTEISSPTSSITNSVTTPKSFATSSPFDSKPIFASHSEKQTSLADASANSTLPLKTLEENRALFAKPAPTSNLENKKCFANTPSNLATKYCTPSNTLSTSKPLTKNQTKSLAQITAPLSSGAVKNSLASVNRSFSVSVSTGGKSAPPCNTPATTPSNVVGLQRQKTMTNSSLIAFSNVNECECVTSQSDTPLVDRGSTDSNKRRNVQALMQRFQQLEQKTS